MRTQHSRREFLRFTLVLSGITSLAAACAPAAAPPAAAPPATTVPAGAKPTSAPAAVAATAGKLPSPMVGVPDGYTQLPKLYKSYDGVPGRGGKVNVFTIAYQPPPTPRDGNAMWQELEKRLGAVQGDGPGRFHRSDTLPDGRCTQELQEPGHVPGLHVEQRQVQEQDHWRAEALAAQ